MDSLFAARRKFTWGGCTFCSLFTLSLFGAIGYGGSVLSEAGKSTRISQISLIKDQISLWNQSLPGFTGMTISVQAKDSDLVSLLPDDIDDYYFKGVKLPPYPHFKYYANTTLIKPGASLEKTEVLNLTSDLTFTYTLPNKSEVYTKELPGIVVFQKAKASLNQKKCVWDQETQECLSHFILSTLCFVFNTTSLSLDSQGCIGSIETWKVYIWDSLTLPTNFSSPVAISLRSDNDPIIFAFRTGTGHFSPSNSEFLIMGSILIVVASLFLLIPIMYFWSVFRGKDRLLQKFEMEMSNIKEGYAPRY